MIVGGPYFLPDFNPDSVAYTFVFHSLSNVAPQFFKKRIPLRTVPPFVTAHTFCESRDIRVFLRNLPPNTRMLLRGFSVYYYVEKADLNEGYQNPKRKLGVTTHFSEISEL